MQLDFTLNFHNDTWYPTVDISGFKSITGASVDIQEKMILTFSAPGKITAGDITISTNPWCELKTNIETSEISSGVFDSKLTITAADGSALGMLFQLFIWASMSPPIPRQNGKPSATLSPPPLTKKWTWQVNWRSPVPLSRPGWKTPIWNWF